MPEIGYIIIYYEMLSLIWKKNFFFPCLFYFPQGYIIHKMLGLKTFLCCAHSRILCSLTRKTAFLIFWLELSAMYLFCKLALFFLVHEYHFHQILHHHCAGIPPDLYYS